MKSLCIRVHTLWGRKEGKVLSLLSEFFVLGSLMCIGCCCCGRLPATTTHTEQRGEGGREDLFIYADAATVVVVVLLRLDDPDLVFASGLRLHRAPFTPQWKIPLARLSRRFLFRERLPLSGVDRECGSACVCVSNGIETIKH